MSTAPIEPSNPDQADHKRANAIVEMVVIVLVAVGLALAIQAFIVTPSWTPTGSMAPTLDAGQRFLVDRIGMAINGPHVGEIVVFHPPIGADERRCGVPYQGKAYRAPCSVAVSEQDTGVMFVKRIVAGPGDEIYIYGGHVFRKAAGDSEFLSEKDSYIALCGRRPEQSCTFPSPIKIPHGHWFMMGDNRGESDDSRFWGSVPTGWIIGGVFATYWPPDRIGLL